MTTIPCELEQCNDIRDRPAGHAPCGSDFAGNALGFDGIDGGEVFEQKTRNLWSWKPSDRIAAGGEVVSDMGECPGASPVSDASATQGTEETVMSVQKRELEEAHGDAEGFTKTGHGRVSRASLP